MVEIVEKASTIYPKVETTQEGASERDKEDQGQLDPTKTFGAGCRSRRSFNVG